MKEVSIRVVGELLFNMVKKNQSAQRQERNGLRLRLLASDDQCSTGSMLYSVKKICSE